jgi:hypothetical protein
MSRMGDPRRIAWRRVLLSLLAGASFFGHVLVCAPASAQDAETGAADAEAGASAEEAEAGDEKEPGQTPEQPGPVEHLTRSAVELERLAGEAYPEPHVRGIHGGSLWLTMHGLQWPYMPAPDESVSIGFSGSAWVDTSYGKIDSGLPDTDPSIKEWRQQSRFVLRITPTFNYKENWFLQTQGELVLTGAAPTRAEDFLVADDLYVRVGKWQRFDLTAGRFQGWEIYHLGMGLDLNTVERDGARTVNNRPVDLYGVTYFWDRPNGPGRLALHYYASDALRFELLGQIGASSLNVLGVRPVGIFDIGLLKVKLGAEYGEETPREQSADRKDRIKRRGVGGTVQVVVDPIFEAGVALAHTLVDTWNAQGELDAGRSITGTSYGVFANVRPVERFILGAGLNYAKEHNLKLDPTLRLNDQKSHLLAFGAAQFAVWDQLFLKGVLAYANAHFNPESDPPPITEFRNKSLSFRLRLMYLF